MDYDYKHSANTQAIEIVFPRQRQLDEMYSWLLETRQQESGGPICGALLNDKMEKFPIQKLVLGSDILNTIEVCSLSKLTRVCMFCNVYGS